MWVGVPPTSVGWIAHCCTIFLKSSGYRNIDVDDDIDIEYRVASGVWKIIDDHFFLSPYYRLFDTLPTFLFSGYMVRLRTQLSGDFKNR